MRRHNFQRFQDRLYNLSRQNSLVLGEILMLDRQLSSGLEIDRILRVPHNSVLLPGDHVLYQKNHFLVGLHADQTNGTTFRLYSLAEQVRWNFSNTVVIDPITGLERTAAMQEELIWVRRDQTGMEKELDGSKRPTFKYLTYANIQNGDLLDGYPVRNSWLEQGLHHAVT